MNDEEGEKKVTLTLTQKEVQLVLSALQEMSIRMGLSVFLKIQAQSQSKKE